MADELLRYVEQQLKAGYSPIIVKNNLIRQGYSPALVDGVIQSVQASMVSTAHIPSGSPNNGIFSKVFIVITILAVIGAAAFFLPKMINNDALLDVKLSTGMDDVRAGESLDFKVEIYNMGSADKFDVTLTYRVFDSQDNSILTKEETVAVSTSLRHDNSLMMPAAAKPGTYTLKVFANYEGKVASSSFSFNVIKAAIPNAGKESCSDSIRNQDEEGIDCGGTCGGYWYNSACHSIPEGTVIPGEELPVENCNDGVWNQDEEGIDCGGTCGGYWYNSACHSEPEASDPSYPIESTTAYSDIMAEVRQNGAQNPDAAKDLCEKVSSQAGMDSCFILLSQASNNDRYCEFVQGYEERDSCLAPFYMEGDYSVCSRLRLAENKETCAKLRDIEFIRKEVDKQSADNPIQPLNSTLIQDYFDS